MPPDSLAGYRVLRKLGRGSQGVFYLGMSASGGGLVALKLQPRDAESAGRDVAVASAVASDRHLVAALDLASYRSDSCLVFPWMPGGTLAQLLERRGSLPPGEAVTVAIAVARGLSELHRAGFAHGRVSTHRILMDAVGTPRLAGLGGAGLLADLDGAARTRAVERDFGQLKDVFDRITDVSPTATFGAIGDTLERAFEGPWREDAYASSRQRLEDALFGYTAAQPLAGVTVAGVSGQAADDRPAAGDREPLSPVESVALEQPRGHGRRAARPANRSVTRTALPAWNAPFAVAKQYLERLRRAIRNKRRLVWFGAVVAAALAALGFTMLPPQPADARPGDSETVASAGSTTTKPTPDALPADAPGDEVATTGDDPVAAVLALLTQRDRCLSAASLACLEEVDQAGSPLLDADRSAVAAARAGEGGDPDRVEFGGGRASLIDRTGGSALLSVTPKKGEPASLLLVRGETGWRLRELFGS